MKKFKKNERGFLDNSYNFEDVKQQFQNEIDDAKKKLKGFKEGLDYTVSYEDNGQKKVYTVHSLDMKKIYWGDNVPNGFKYSLEEDRNGVRTKMKMIGLETQNYSRNRIENVDDKISNLYKELHQKESDVQLLNDYPEKKEKIEVEIENIKHSIRELTEQSQSDENAVRQSENDNGRSRNQGHGNLGLWGVLISLISLFSLIGIASAAKTR